MLSHLAKSVAALSLVLAAQASIPGLSTPAIAAPGDRKCTAKTHRHGKVAKAVAAKPAPRGAGMVQQRRTTDVQVLSFGP